MAVTVPVPVSRHLVLYVAAAVAAVALVVSVLIGLAIADSDSTAVARTTSEVVNDPPGRFDRGTPDAIERRAADDPLRYGSPDAAEEWNR